jgi:hypothetical protein
MGDNVLNWANWVHSFQSAVETWKSTSLYTELATIQNDNIEFKMDTLEVQIYNFAEYYRDAPGDFLALWQNSVFSFVDELNVIMQEAEDFSNVPLKTLVGHVTLDDKSKGPLFEWKQEIEAIKVLFLEFLSRSGNLLYPGDYSAFIASYFQEGKDFVHTQVAFSDKSALAPQEEYKEYLRLNPREIQIRSALITEISNGISDTATIAPLKTMKEYFEPKLADKNVLLGEKLRILNSLKRVDDELKPMLLCMYQIVVRRPLFENMCKTNLI